MLQLFEYSKLFLQLGRSCELFIGPDDFKVARFVCLNHTDNDIQSDHSYLDTLGIPLNSTLNWKNVLHKKYTAISNLEMGLVLFQLVGQNLLQLRSTQ